MPPILVLVEIRPGILARGPWRPEQVPGGLRAARAAAGLTKVALGRAVGRSGQAVRNWETGRTHAGPATCRRLEVVLRLCVGTLPF